MFCIREVETLGDSMRGNLQAVKKVLSELNVILSKDQKRQSIKILTIIIFSAGFELIGITAILPFLQVILTPEVVMNHELAQPIVHIFHIENDTQMLILMGTGVILIYIIKNLYMLFSYYMQYDYSTKIQKELSIKLLKSYMTRPYEALLDINSADILRGCNTDINGVYNTLSNLFTIMAEGLAAVAIGIFIIYTDPWIAISVLVLMALVMIGMILFFKPIMKRMGKKMVFAQSEKTKAIYQTTSGLKELFVMQRKELFADEFAQASDGVRVSQRNYEFIVASQERIIEGICVSGLIGIVVIRLLMGMEILSFVPKLGVFAMAAFKIMPSIGKISSRVTGIIYHIPMLDIVYNMVVEAEDFEKKQSNYISTGQENTGCDRFHEVLSIKHVQWKYKEQEIPVLTDVNINIKRGESIALIGASGSGKTTLSDVILGLLYPQSGGVYMDGIDVYTMPKTWAGIIGYVPQSVFLFDDTIRNNVLFGLKDAKDEDVWYALEQAQLKTFVESLPKGLDTIVGERGVKLSGGQRQRIAIARALFSKPQILVLDEATAALDNETESAVMESIDALQGHITMIIVAHRLTTIRNCNRIYEIKDGIAVQKELKDVM